MQHSLAPGSLPDGWVPVICIGFLTLSSALAQSLTKREHTFVPNPRLKSPRFHYLQQQLVSLLYGFEMTSTFLPNFNCEIFIGREAARKMYVFQAKGLHQILLVAALFLSKKRNH